MLCCKPVQIPYGCNNSFSVQEPATASAQKNSNIRIYNDLRGCPNRSPFRSAVFHVFFLLFRGSLFHNDFHRGIHTNPFISDGFERKDDPAGTRQSTKSTQRISRIRASRISHRQTTW